MVQTTERSGMEFLALVYDDPSAWERMTAEEQAEAMKGYVEVAQDASAAGVLVAGSALAPTAAATSVRLRDGETIVTDGPYADVKESLGGYYLLSCGSMQQAIEWAARIPSVWHGGAVEVRPVHADEEAAA
jgi:hypothetical protein